MKKSTRILVSASLVAALVCVATVIIKIPSPFKGYINFGDCMVLLAGWILSPVYAFLAAGLGSALADMFSGYVLYAPATFVIKGLSAVTAYFVFSLLRKRIHTLSAEIIAGISAEIVMVSGYYLFEGVIYGFAASLVNIPANAVQGIVGLILGVIIIKIFQKTKIKI